MKQLFDMKLFHTFLTGLIRAFFCFACLYGAASHATGVNDATVNVDPPAFKHAKTNLLDIAYLEYGPQDGAPILLYHGWPDSPYAWKTVAPALARHGYRVLVPTLRGFGETRFLSAKTPRSGQATALAQDVIDFADALHINRFTLVGHDWGAGFTYHVAAQWPLRVENLVTISVAYQTGNKIENLQADQVRAFWYQWLFQSPQAKSVLTVNRQAICRELWQTIMPADHFDEKEFLLAAPFWDNPDWIDVTLSHYNLRWLVGTADPQYEKLDIAAGLKPKISVPTILIYGKQDGGALPATIVGDQKNFSGSYEQVLLPGIGHFVTHEDPNAVVDVILRSKKAAIH